MRHETVIIFCHYWNVFDRWIEIWLHFFIFRILHFVLGKKYDINENRLIFITAYARKKKKQKNNVAWQFNQSFISVEIQS